MLDLFSGIGGHAIALQPISRPCGFCDIEPFCQSVLRARFKHVPVFDDVRKLDFNSPDINHRPSIPDVITASFPCQDISALGSRAGVHGMHSKLVFDVFRLLDSSSRAAANVKALFMENSPLIRSNGLDVIVEECRKRGFTNIAWTYISANDIGGGHRRRRWFFMAMRPHAKLKRVGQAHILRLTKLLDVTLTTVPRLKGRTDTTLKHERLRMAALGNAVVPACSAIAWNTLVDALMQKSLTRVAWSVFTKMDDSEETVLRKVLAESSPTKPLGLKFPDGYTGDYWTTPIHRMATLYPTNTWNGRYRRMLASQVFYERSTKRQFRYRDVVLAKKKWVLNPNWVENLMGFPQAWTNVEL